MGSELIICHCEGKRERKRERERGRERERKRERDEKVNNARSDALEH